MHVYVCAHVYRWSREYALQTNATNGGNHGGETTFETTIITTALNDRETDTDHCGDWRMPTFSSDSNSCLYARLRTVYERV